MFEPFVFKGVTMEPGDVVSIEYKGRFGTETALASVVQLVEDVWISEGHDVWNLDALFHDLLEVMCAPLDRQWPAGFRHFFRTEEVQSIRVVDGATTAIPRLAGRNVRRGQVASVQVDQGVVKRVLVRSAMDGGILMGDALTGLTERAALLNGFTVAPTGSRVVAHVSRWSV